MSLLHAITNQAHSRVERNLCRVNEFFDQVVGSCALCSDVCEAKFRAGLPCLECKDYTPHTNDPVGGIDDKVAILLLALLAFATVLVITAVIILGVKLHKQNDRINRGKLLEEEVMDVEAKANDGSHSNEVQAENIHTSYQPLVHKYRATDNIYEGRHPKSKTLSRDHTFLKLKSTM